MLGRIVRMWMLAISGIRGVVGELGRRGGNVRLWRSVVVGVTVTVMMVVVRLVGTHGRRGDGLDMGVIHRQVKRRKQPERHHQQGGGDICEYAVH